MELLDRQRKASSCTFIIQPLALPDLNRIIASGRISSLKMIYSEDFSANCIDAYFCNK